MSLTSRQCNLSADGHLGMRLISKRWAHGLLQTVCLGRAVAEGLKYAKSHEWAKVDGDIATIGISDFAQVRPLLPPCQVGVWVDMEFLKGLFMLTENSLEARLAVV